MNNILLFDIDLCLIDTNVLKRNLKKTIISKLKINETKFNDAHNIYYKSLKTSKDFKPENYCKYFAKQFNYEFKKLISLFYSDERLYKNILYKDTLPQLLILKKQYTIGIFSEGFKKYQVAKLKHSGILPYLNNKYIFISRRKLSKPSIALLPKNSIIIDDNPDIVKKLTDKGLTAVLLDRKSTSNFRNIKSIHSLKELIYL